MYYLDNHLQLSWVIIEENLPFLLDVMLFFFIKKKFLYLICMLESDDRINIKSTKQN